jgi:hypothetical protein
MEPNLAGSIYVRSSIKLLHIVPFGQQTWPLYLLQNCRACRSWHAAHVCCLNLTSISYSFLNKKQKVLKFWIFDEKRTIYSSETTGPNGTKLGRKHLYKVLYKVSSFRPIPPTNMAAHSIDSPGVTLYQQTMAN